MSHKFKVEVVNLSGKIKTDKPFRLVIVGHMVGEYKNHWAAENVAKAIRFAHEKDVLETVAEILEKKS